MSKDDMDGMVKSRNDENQALVAHNSKGRRGSPRRRSCSEREESP